MLLQKKGQLSLLFQRWLSLKQAAFYLLSLFHSPVVFKGETLLLNSR